MINKSPSHKPISAYPLYRPRLVIMMKAPRMGSVKTRLAKDIGAVAAVQFYRTLLRHLVQRLSPDPRWETILAFTPDEVSPNMFFSPNSKCAKAVKFIPQGSGHLGDRMQRLFDHLPPGPVIIIGSDIPEINAALIAKAFRQLQHTDFVIGPGMDGGYWLIGQRRLPKTTSLFRGVSWSSSTTLENTLENMPERSVVKMPVLVDVDGKAEYKALWGTAQRGILRQLTTR